MVLVPLLLAQGIASPGIPLRRGIAPPSERSVETSGGGEILPPQEPGGHGPDVETPLERRRRLEEAGIVAPPPPRKRVPKGWERYADALNPEAETPSGEPMPQGFRIDATAGGWYALHAPNETRYIPDFSYGFSLLWPLESTVRAASGRYHSVFVGASATYLNGGTYQSVSKGYRGKGTVYADTNSSEFGLDLVLAQETSLSPWLTFSAEGRATWAPVRQVRVRYDSYAQSPGRSEVGSHTRFNPAGFGFGVAGVFTLSRVFGAGLFGAVSLANPLQARARLGFMFVVASTRPPPASAGTPSEGAAKEGGTKDGGSKEERSKAGTSMEGRKETPAKDPASTRQAAPEKAP